MASIRVLSINEAFLEKCKEEGHIPKKKKLEKCGIKPKKKRVKE